MEWLSRLCWLPLLLGAAPLVHAQAEDYRIDPVHTRIVFLVDHAGLSRSMGSFSGITGQLRFDEDDWSGASLDIRVPLASLDLGDDDWNEKMLQRSFLDAAGQPEARFLSTRVEPGEPGHALVHGELTLRGVTREVALDVRMNALKRNPVTFRRSAGFSATASLSRGDFGMDSWPNVIGDEIELLIEAEAIRGRNDPATPTPEQDDADQE